MGVRKPVPLVMIMGPTATGKSALALELAHSLDAEIVSVDSALVYRGMDIGTAKPSPQERVRVAHHLIDVAAPHEAYSAARFCTDAARAIASIRAAGKTPLLVGGTMLYFTALQRGLSPLPAADSRLRENLSARARAIGWRELHGELAAVDPAAAQRIHPNDPQRIQRALEVWHLTGVPLSEHHRAAATPPQPPPAVKIVLSPLQREDLHRRIAHRFDAMLAAGLVEEVAMLRRDVRVTAGSPAMRAVGYRQVWNFLDGDWSFDEMRERAIVNSRQLAKRQLTWLRREPDARWFAASRTPVRRIRDFVYAAIE